MDSDYSSYHENLFQWIWQQLEFDCSGLQTDCGKSLIIAGTGYLNHGAGPDFLQAQLIIDGVQWHGSVEIHKSSEDWLRHKHHLDPNYNNVILHVVYSDENRSHPKTKAGASLYTLSLKTRLHKSLQKLLILKKSKQLPCGGQITFANQRAFDAQIRKAHGQYFEFKVKEILAGYPADRPVSEAWKWSFIRQMFSTFGIPGNRESMLQLCDFLMQKGLKNQTVEDFIREAEKSAFDNSSIVWIDTGMRPAGRPAKRVVQAAALCYAILQAPFGLFLEKPEIVWNSIVQEVSAINSAGKRTSDLIFYTNFLPAMYLLGDLLHFDGLKSSARDLWLDGSQIVPEEIKKPFSHAGFSLENCNHKLGLAHHYKRYCSERNCHRCEVFKSAIRS